MRQVAVDGQLISYQEIGSGNGAPILILHGWGRSGQEWLGVGSELSRWTGRKVYVTDLPGFGGSSLPKKVTTIEEYSGIVSEFCRYLKIEKISIVGHSLGGRVGIVLAATEPTLVEKLILVDPAGVRPFSLKRIAMKSIAKAFRWVPVSLRRTLAAGAMDEDYKNSPALRDLYRAVVGRDLRDMLPSIKCPVRLIWGEKDPILPLSLTRIYKAKLADARLRVVWEAGHDPHLTHTREFARILEEEWSG